MSCQGQLDNSMEPLAVVMILQIGTALEYRTCSYDNVSTQVWKHSRKLRSSDHSLLLELTNIYLI